LLNLHDGGVWHAQPITLDMNPARGHCNGTRYVARQVYTVAYSTDSYSYTAISLQRGQVDQNIR